MHVRYDVQLGVYKTYFQANGFCSEQCEQMSIWFVQYLAIYNSKN